jgi:hypothetical protein
LALLCYHSRTDLRTAKGYRGAWMEKRSSLCYCAQCRPLPPPCMRVRAGRPNSLGITRLVVTHDTSRVCCKENVLSACIARTYTGHPPSAPPVHLYPRFPHYIPHEDPTVQAQGGDMHRLRYHFFVRTPASPPLATPTPSQVCRSHAAHLRTRQFSRFKSSSVPYLIFSSLKVGQINTSSVPRGIAMVCHLSRLSA